MSEEEKIETFDAAKGVGILSGKPPSERALGPYRRAPMFYAGETYGRRRMLYPDVERHQNGALPAQRNKFARRLIRAAFKRHHSSVERGLKLPRAMLAQARLVAKEDKKSRRWARRLLEKELAIHQAMPNEPSRAQKREYARKLKREGKLDAISQLVDRMAAGEIKL